MDTKCVLTVCTILACFVLVSAVSTAQEIDAVKLPNPHMTGGKPLMEALKERRTSRDFSSEKLPMQLVSDMLWAAFGINRAESGKRTAPSAMNWQEIDIYVSMEEGLYLYDAKANTLKPILDEDVRADTGLQPFVPSAPVNLIFVADYSRTGGGSQADKDFYSAADTGFISQNVYLFCASEGLATVVRGWLDRDALAKKMGLREDQKVILAQTVGYPKEVDTDEAE